MENHDLFSFNNSPKSLSFSVPLAEKLRPVKLDDFFGHEKTFGINTRIGRALREGRVNSMIFWGPPGTGKTSLARMMSGLIDAEFIALNAVSAGVKEIREIGEIASNRLRNHSKRTIVFLDEIHRLNKSQQDVLLPFIESGAFTLIGATTENPSYELNRALLSRAEVIIFERLSAEDLHKILQANLEKLGFDSDIFHPEAISLIIENSNGDARRMQNDLAVILEAKKSTANASAVAVTESSSESDAASVDSFIAKDKQISKEEILSLLSDYRLGYDKSSDEHYDCISAFIKSVRGSDSQAAVYYLARMIEGGEDPVFIARRLIILSSEDIGNADPRAITIATSALAAVEAIGMPEARIVLSQAALYLSCAPKSNSSYKAINQAAEFVRRTGNIPVPLALRSSKTELNKNQGYGSGYDYPHDHFPPYSRQDYLPEQASNQIFFEPSVVGFEKQMGEYLKWLRSAPEKK